MHVSPQYKDEDDLFFDLHHWGLGGIRQLSALQSGG